MHRSSQSRAEFCSTLLWTLSCYTHECCDLGKNRAISLFCRLCKHSTGATAECSRMLGPLAICEGTVDTRICGITRFMNWLQSINPLTNKKYLLQCCWSIFTQIFALFTSGLLKCCIKWHALFQNLVSSLAVCIYTQQAAFSEDSMLTEIGSSRVSDLRCNQ